MRDDRARREEYYVLHKRLKSWANGQYPYDADNPSHNVKGDLIRFFQLEETFQLLVPKREATSAFKDSVQLADIINYAVDVIRKTDVDYEDNEITEDIRNDRVERVIDMVDFFMKYNPNNNSRDYQTHRDFTKFVLRKMAETNTRSKPIH